MVTNGLDPKFARKLLGRPQSIERCDALELYVYRDRARERMKWQLRYGRWSR